MFSNRGKEGIVCAVACIAALLFLVFYQTNDLVGKVFLCVSILISLFLCAKMIALDISDFYEKRSTKHISKKEVDMLNLIRLMESVNIDVHSSLQDFYMDVLDIERDINSDGDEENSVY